MKKLLSLTILFMTVSLTGYGNALTERVSNDQADPVQTYDIRLGLITTSGNPTLSGSYDLGGFYAVNIETGEYYYSGRHGGGLLQLPAFINDLPEGTYEFGAFRGQGGWMAVNSKIVTISPGMEDADGYITIYLDIAWVE